MNKGTETKGNGNHAIKIDGGKISGDLDREDYLCQICSVFEWLGEVTLSKIRDVDGTNGYTYDADSGHSLVFDMAIRELRKFGDLVGCHTEATTVYNATPIKEGVAGGEA